MQKIKAQFPQPTHPTEFMSTYDDSGYSICKNEKKQRKIVKKSNIIKFQHFSYPFLNQHSIAPKIFKTQILIGSQQIELINTLKKINHPNLIIPKQLHQKSLKNYSQMHSVLDVVYQEVAFSIKFIGFGDTYSSSLYRKIADANFKDILNKVSIYLMKLRINRVIKLADIGVTQSGIIKIFVPPEALLKNNEALPQHVVFSNNYKLVNWWETTFNQQTKQLRQFRLYSPKNNANILQTIKFNHFKQDRENNSFLNRVHETRKFSNNFKEIERQGLQATKGSQRQSFQFRRQLLGFKQIPIMNTSTKSHDCILCKIGTMHAEKIKRIDRQIKQIKQRLVRRQTLKFQKQDSNHLIHFQNETIKDSSPVNLLSSRLHENSQFNFQSKPQEQKIYRDSIKNINCINIYHPQNPNVIGFVQKKKATFAKIHYLDPLECVSNQDSLDTYDIQFCDNQESRAIRPKSQLHCCKYERQISQRNCKVNRENEVESKDKTKKFKNQVESRTFQTESAGPRQFKNFIKNCTEPQFLYKKSNINEDPKVQESQHQPIPYRVHYNKLAEAGRSVISKTRESVSNRKQKNRSRDKKNQIAVMQIFEWIPKVRSIINSGTGLKYSVRVHTKTQGETFLAKKKLQVRVHNIVQKTKNVIANLNRMKEGNGFIRKAMSP